MGHRRRLLLSRTLPLRRIGAAAAALVVMVSLTVLGPAAGNVLAAPAVETQAVGPAGAPAVGPAVPVHQIAAAKSRGLLAENPAAAANAVAAAPYFRQLASADGGKRTTYFVHLTGNSVGTTLRQAQGRGAAAAHLAAVGTAAIISADVAEVGAGARSSDPQAKVLYTTKNAIPGFAVTTDAATAATLSRRSDVVSVTPMTRNTIANSSTDEFTGVLAEWQNTGLLGAGVKVGIVDTGVDYTHADFGGAGTVAAYTTAKMSAGFVPTAKVVGGYDFAGDDYDANGAATSTPHPDANPLDCYGHGSHVAGTLAGYGENPDGSTFTGSYSGLTAESLQQMKIGPGVAPAASLYALKVFGCEGSSDLVMAALDWALDPNGDQNFADHLDIVNMSLGSDYSAEDDPENAMIDTLATYGVLSVVASGNAGDLTLIGGAPGNAASALTVANSIGGALPFDGASVTAPAGLAGVKAGQYSVDYTGPTTPIARTVVTLTANSTTDEGCDAYTAAESSRVAGKFVWLNWPAAFTCGSKVRADNALAAGAKGVVLSSTENVFSAGVAGDAALPMFQLTKTASSALSAAARSGALAMTFDFARGVIAAVPDGDTLNSSSSRGVYGSVSTVKPDVAAPGTQILSTGMGTGSGGVVFTGTSMATPHVAGIAALVKQAHPGWTAGQIKADVMNTAVHDITTGSGGTGDVYGPNRVGSGRVDAVLATTNTVLAYVQAADAGPGSVGGAHGVVPTMVARAVSASFGVVEVPASRTVPLTETRAVTIENDGASDVTAQLSYAPATAQRGVSVSVSPSSVIVPAGGTRAVTVTLSAGPGTIGRDMDPTMEPFQDDLTRDFTPLTSGRLIIDTGTSALRVPVSAAVKPVSTTHAALNSSLTSLTITGAGFDGSATVDANGYGGYTSAFDVFALGGTSPKKPVCAVAVAVHCSNGPRDASGDLRYAGATSDYSAAGDDDFATVAFGISTWADWTAPGTSTTPYVDIWTVSNPATRPPDYELFAAPYQELGVDEDYYAAVLVYLPTGDLVADLPLNLIDPGIIDPNVFDADAVKLATPLAALYEAEGAPASSVNHLHYRVGTYSLQGYGADDPIDQIPAGAATIAFNPRDPGVAATEGLLWPDMAGPAIPLSVSATNTSLGALVLHQNGATGQRAEVLPIPLRNRSLPTITGTVKLGATLTATRGTWSIAPSSTGYQWLRNGIAISGASASTYKPVVADVGQKLSVRVTATVSSSGYSPVSATSAATTVAPGTFVATSVPRITGTAKVGSTLTASRGTWSPTPSANAYRWLRNGVAITGATHTTYKLTAADAGKRITVKITVTLAGYTPAYRISPATATVAPGTFVATSVPRITGTAKVGSTLTAAHGTWSPAPSGYAYRWLRNGVAITGATHTTYKLTAADAGKRITVKITVTLAGYTPAYRISPATATVAPGTFVATSVPRITGTAKVGSTLTASRGTWSPAPSGYAYRWLRNGVAITGATHTTYKLTAADAGKRITVKITVTLAGYTPAYRISPATAAIR